jgi:uncharacterized protein (UPF0335 family)
MNNETPGPGHNGIAGDRLRTFVERIERLEEEKAALTVDIREVYAEAKGNGFDTRIMRRIVKDRRAEAQDIQDFEEMLDLYRHALGMLSGTPLGEAAISAARNAEAVAAS